jgi:Tfp pilus assembly protein PilZ
MSQNTERFDGDDIQKGNTGLLCIMNDHFMVEILDVGEENLHVSFPGMDYPIEGMPCDLEFHDKTGFNCYRTVVTAGPAETGSGVLLARPHTAGRARHRDSCRIQTDLSAQVKDQVHVRRHDADVINLSSGGALIATRAPFTYETTVEMTLSLPGQPSLQLLASVAHVSEQDDSTGQRLVGVRFSNPDGQTLASLTTYIWGRLRELYAAP